MGPEYESVETFAEFLMADDRTSFTLADVVTLATNTQTSDPKVIDELKSYGFTMVKREPPKVVRGFQSNSHDRWYGKGSSPSHGGSGWEQISGFAGQEG
jgi:hypothetical protein